MKTNAWKMVLGVALLGLVAGSAHAEGDAAEGGTVTGVMTRKDGATIFVKADGAEESVKYRPRWSGGMPKDGGGFDKAIEEQIKKIPVTNRVRVTWVLEEGRRVTAIECLKPEGEKGVNEGTVTEVGENFIEIRTADGTFERYLPHWREGGLDKEMLAKIRNFKTGQKVRVEWVYDERKRVVGISGQE